MNFDRIILCTDAPHGQGLAYYYYRAFCDEVGHEKVRIIDEGDRQYGASLLERGSRRLKHDLGWLSRRRYNRLLSDLAVGKNLVILFNSGDLANGEIRKLADHSSIYLVNYLSDSPYGIVPSRQEGILNSIPYFRLVCIFAKDLMPVLYQLGAQRVERIPFGYCKYTHLEPSKNIQVEFPDNVFYFGTWTPEIESWLEPLSSYGLHIEGNGWGSAARRKLREVGTRKKPNTDHNMAIMARKAGVVVNFTRAKHGCFHTMKTFELAVAGACVLSNFSEEQNEFFKDNESMAYFNTVDEMKMKIEYFLKEPSEAHRLRDEARKAAMPHSYHNRCQSLMALLEQ